MARSNKKQDQAAWYTMIDARDIENIMVRPATVEEVNRWVLPQETGRYFLNLALVQADKKLGMVALVFLIDEPTEGINMEVIYQIITDYLGRLTDNPDVLGGMSHYIN